jgi:stress up-regulated protein Nod 19
MRRRLALAFTLAAALAGLATAPASGRTRTYTLRYGPIHMGPFQVKLPKVYVPTPRRTGYITRMHARLVNRRGRRIDVRRVMLHHIVFMNAGRSKGDRTTSCSGRNGEPIYGTGEENESLLLPPGYGYFVRARDRWRMQTMLMSHRLAQADVYVQYRVTVETGRRLTRVKPFWVRVTGCQGEPSYNVNGRGEPGTIATKTASWRAPFSGRIVASGAHLHGGSFGIRLTEPACGDRTLVESKPLFGMPDDIVYRVFPVLHEPGPVSTTWTLSRAGVPVVKGEPLHLSADYDGQYNHAGVMGIMHLYIARGRRSTARCAPMPTDVRSFQFRTDGRTEPPRVEIPLSALDDDGRLTTIDRPPGPLHVLRTGATVPITGDFFPRSNLSIPQDATVTWRFDDRVKHKIFPASGPMIVSTGMLNGGAVRRFRFTRPGTYKLFCPLHPVTMHQVITVRPRPQ